MLKLYKLGNTIVASNNKTEIAQYFKVSQTKITPLNESDIDSINTEDTIVFNMHLIDIQKSKLNDIECRMDFFNEPNKSFDIGQKVNVGNLVDYIIVDIKHNGKVILIKENIDFIMEDFKIGSEIINLKSNNVRHVYLAWHEVFTNEVKAQDTLFLKDHLELNFNGMTLESIIHKNYFIGIDKEPEYQRELVWSEEDQLLLIESIFDRLDIGKFVLVEKPFDPFNPGYEILDGKQRLHAILSFIEDRFKFKGFYFSELLPSDRRKFMNLPIPLAIIQDKKVDRAKIINYFIRLNTCGKQVDRNFLNRLKNSI